MAYVTTAIYLRMSMDRTGDEMGIDRYREQCVRVCDRNGFGSRVEYIDNDVSASGTRGPATAYARMLADARAGRIAVVVVADLDRLTRTPREIEDWIELAERHGVRLITADGEIDAATENGRMYLRIKAAVARHEVERKGKRQRDAAAQAASQGRRFGGRRAFGYDQDGMREVAQEADAVRWAYGALLAGVSLGGIAKEWNERGLVKTQGAYTHGCADSPCQDETPARNCPQGVPPRNPWDRLGVRSVLMNPRNAGLRAHVTAEVRAANPKQPQAARLAGIVGPAAWPGLVPESTWRAAVALLGQSGRVTRGRTPIHLLTGIAVCGVCDGPVHAGAASTKLGGHRTYRCKNFAGHVGRAAGPVDWLVTELIVGRMSRPDAARLLERRNAPDAAEVESALLAVRTRRRNVVSLVADGTFTTTEARSQVADLDAEIAKLEARLTDAGRVNALGPLVGVDDVRAAWEGLSIERQRAALAALVRTIRLLPPGRGARFGRDSDAWLDNWEKIAATIEVAWIGED